MFLIRRLADPGAQANRGLLADVQDILRKQFPALRREEVEALPSALREPTRADFVPQLFVAEDARHRLRGFALVKLAPDLKFLYLDYLASSPGDTGGGIGGAIYQRLREHAAEQGLVGIFMECLPDDPELSPDARVRRQNEARLKFYERFDARPVANTEYATPVKPGDSDPPYLVMDPLGSDDLPDRDTARRIVRAILERKYGDHCSPDYVRRVVHSVTDDPIRLREPRYRPRTRTRKASVPAGKKIALIVNARHEIHHVRERGYVQSPVRMRSILKELEPTGLFERVDAQEFPERHVTAVHDKAFVAYLKQACAHVPEGKSVYPYVFPIRNQARKPDDLALHAGYYCIDTFTPVNRNAWPAARGAVDCALTGARQLLDGRRFGYALVRPPGHHAEHDSFGGFCYLNSNAIAAQYLSEYGKVAVLDIDYHHGNGAQDIFYRRADVLTVSIHGHPRFTYPYFAGFEDERGEAEGEGFNLNFPLKEGLDGQRYAEVLERALKRVRRFAPDYLVLALGLDTAKGDPTGSFTLTGADFENNGRLIGALGLPTLVVQEGGYRTRTLGINARRFFTGLAAGRG